jgi:hypothetical protein
MPLQKDLLLARPILLHLDNYRAADTARFAYVGSKPCAEKTGFLSRKKLEAKDHLIDWEKPKRKPDWINQSDYDTLPDKILIREFSVGRIVYVTTLLNAKQYHKKELAEFYRQRWLIEIDQPCCLHKSVLRKLLYRFCDWFYPGTINSPQFT